MKDTLQIQLIAGTPDSEARPQEFSRQYVAKVLTSGQFEHGLNTASLQSYKYGPGDMLLPRRSVKEWVRWKDPLQMLMIEVPDTALTAVAQENGEDTLELVGTPFLFDPRVTALILAVEAEQANEFSSGKLFLDSIGQALASALTQTAGRSKRITRPYTGGLAPARLRQLASYVHEHIKGDLSLDELSREAGLSRAQFSKVFRRSSGQTPHEFVLQKRVERAKAMLDQKNLSIIDVAVGCGFQTAQHFARVFRAACGVSPSAYRNERGSACQAAEFQDD